MEKVGDPSWHRHQDSAISLEWYLVSLRWMLAYCACVCEQSCGEMAHSICIHRKTTSEFAVTISDICSSLFRALSSDWIPSLFHCPIFKNQGGNCGISAYPSACHLLIDPQSSVSAYSSSSQMIMPSALSDFWLCECQHDENQVSSRLDKWIVQSFPKTHGPFHDASDSWRSKAGVLILGYAGAAARRFSLFLQFSLFIISLPQVWGITVSVDERKCIFC